MKTLILAAAISALAASAASAADAVIAYDPVPEAAYSPVVNWNGFYAGVHLGYGWGDMDYGADAGDGWEPEGFLGGIQAGYNWQSGNLVFGVEGDASYGGDVDSPYLEDGELSVDEDYYVASVDWFGTLRGRLGYDMNGLMPYVTGGLAVAYVDVSEPGDDESATHVGYALGAGVEYKFTSDWSAKAEYMYMDFGSEDYYGTSTDLSMHTVKIGLNYHF